jgi:hypothetical protein
MSAAGGLTQICVWAPEREADLVRQLCTRIAEPNERGQSLRSRMIDQLDRRRTISSRWSGMSWRCEIDAPLIGPWWFLRHIGGRIFGPHGTHIELTPDESEALQDRLQRACEQEIYAWAKESNLVGSVRDDTGVIVAPRFDKPNKAKRPADEAEFEANESRIARAVLDAAVASRKPPVKDPSVIEYESYSDFPSFCQIAHRRHSTPDGERIQFALIHMPNGGVSPTNMMESLATHLRHQFYPKVDPGKIDWFDVVPPNTYSSVDKFTINFVSMKHANGVYTDPVWSRENDNIPSDWIAFILDTIERSQKSRSLAEKTQVVSPS